MSERGLFFQTGVVTSRIGSINGGGTERGLVRRLGLLILVVRREAVGWLGLEKLNVRGSGRGAVGRLGLVMREAGTMS